MEYQIMKFDIEKLTLGEVSKIEELSGQSIAAIGEDGSPKGKTLAALALVAKRRQGDSEFTWNHAMGLTLDEANEILGMNDEPEEAEAEADPTQPEDSSPSRTGSNSSETEKPEAPQE